MSFWLDLRLIGVTAIHVAGVPFRWLCWLASIPGRDQIEGVSPSNGHVAESAHQTVTTT